MIRRALVSVSDKRGVVELAKVIHDAGFELLSTGGTATALAAAGLPVTQVSAYTGAPEILDGRVKTLHPRIHGGLLGRDTAAHQREMAAHAIAPIDLLVVNLYPFEATVARQGTTFDEAIENIDIGGPAMLRSAAKNHERVAVVVDPADYGWVGEALRAGGLSPAQRLALARRAFAHTAAYDAAIAAYLSSIASPGSAVARSTPEGSAESIASPGSAGARSTPEGSAESIGAGTATAREAVPAGRELPDTLGMAWRRLYDLRYGENPHQRAAFYAHARSPLPATASARPTIAGAEVLGGKQLSYNNILDLDAALGLALEFSEPAAVVVKHNNPCGVAIASPGFTGARRTPGGSAESNASPGFTGARSTPGGSAESIASPGFAGARRAPGGSAESNASRGFAGARSTPGGSAESNASRGFAGARSTPGGSAESNASRSAGARSTPGGSAESIDRDVAAAYRRARDADSLSAYGGIVAVNREVDEALAQLLAETFLECVVAPSYSAAARDVLASRKNLRLVAAPGAWQPPSGELAWSVRTIAGGALVQTVDHGMVDLAAARVASQRAPSDAERADLAFAWRVAKHVKSNAIVFARGGVTVAIGAGQMSRVDSVRICERKAGDKLEGAVVASDAFFPFRDGVDVLAEAGAVAVVQPGGSMRDDEVIRAADEHGLAMLFTGMRHFRH